VPDGDVAAADQRGSEWRSSSQRIVPGG
jgi:hypothetical protein